MGVTFKWIFIIFRCCTLCKVVCTTYIEDCALCKWIPMFAFHKCCQNCTSCLATSPLHNECGDFSSPSMWESSQAASLSTIQRAVGRKAKSQQEWKTNGADVWTTLNILGSELILRRHLKLPSKPAGRRIECNSNNFSNFRVILSSLAQTSFENVDSWSRVASRWKPILWKLLLALL